jgi:chromosome segregation ATPase
MASTVRDAMNMSGGERSYTTISYVLALGSSLLTPFRLMGS